MDGAWLSDKYCLDITSKKDRSEGLMNLKSTQ